MLWKPIEDVGLLPLPRYPKAPAPQDRYLRARPRRTRSCVEDETPGPCSPAMSMAWSSTPVHKLFPYLSDRPADSKIPAAGTVSISRGWCGFRTPPRPLPVPCDHAYTNRPALARERHILSPGTLKMRPRCTLHSFYSS